MGIADRISKRVLLHFLATGRPVSFVELHQDLALSWHAINGASPPHCEETDVQSPVMSQGGGIRHMRWIAAYRPTDQWLWSTITKRLTDEEVEKMLGELGGLTG